MSQPRKRRDRQAGPPTAAPTAAATARTPQRSAWRVVGASIQGRSHARCDTPCQDAHAWDAFDAHTLVAVVADGAGSAARSADGSRVASDRVLEILRERVERGLWPTDALGARAALEAAFTAALAAVRERAEVDEQTYRDFATTLLAAVVTPSACAVLQIGDGGVVATSRRTGELRFTLPPRGEYANETMFLTSDGAIAKAQFAHWDEEIEHVALLTDGLQRLAFDLPRSRPFAPFFAPLFSFVTTEADPATQRESLEGFLRSDRVAEHTDDDLTLLLAAGIGTTAIEAGGGDSTSAGTTGSSSTGIGSTGR